MNNEIKKLRLALQEAQAALSRIEAGTCTTDQSEKKIFEVKAKPEFGFPSYLVVEALSDGQARSIALAALKEDNPTAGWAILDCIECMERPIISIIW